ncbi:type IV inositol polyphosphate 5-phosphatase 9-like [Bidens hawaiensis]|uniref:type IV inositol polyphosphate 5-phosphatase 9-like n=1 Tax=Bidens hawaiensis TaxID=980011 RepID=UPI00404963B0
MWPSLSSCTKILTRMMSSVNFVTYFPISPEPIINGLLKTQNYNIFVSTWNVGGVAPTRDLNIDDLLDTQNTCWRISNVVLRFQEVVPLTTSNVLGLKKDNVSKKWNSLIRKTLNNKSRIMTPKSEFRCLVSKRMVGLLISVWLRSDLYQFVQNSNVSCVGCGIMGRLGNKGSVSVRFLLRDTSFCFVCSHLASGGGEGEEHRRNSNALDIISRTRFPTTNGSSIHIPGEILDHEYV